MLCNNSGNKQCLYMIKSYNAIHMALKIPDMERKIKTISI